MAKRGKQTQKPTRKQVMLSRREREQQRRIYFGLAGVAALILLVLVFGLIYTYVVIPGQAVVVVNGTEFSVADYRKRVQYERFILDEAIANLDDQLQTVSQDASLASLLTQQIQQTTNQLISQRLDVDRALVDRMIEEQLVLDEAERLGIAVSEEEVTARINNIVANRNGGFTEAVIAETATANSQATATAELFTPTPTLTPSPTLTATGAITPPTATRIPPTRQPTVTPVIIAGEALSQAYADWIATLQENTGLSEAEYRQIVRRGLVINALREKLAEQVTPVEEQVQARHILVETEEEIQEVKARLEAGEDFAEVAADVSLDTSNKDQGGDLGFFPRGMMVPEFETVAFDTPIGQVSEPFETSFGWHILEVLAREERELEPFILAQRQAGAYQDWLATARVSNIQNNWSPDFAPPDPERVALQQRLTATSGGLPGSDSPAGGALLGGGGHQGQ
ncbi:MAG: peptidylprolyl isomerase [Anaerolineae bacterium]